MDERRPPRLAAHRPHRHAPVESADRLRGRAGIGVGVWRRAWTLSDSRWRSHLDAYSLRRRRHRGNGRGDGLERSERAVCSDVSAAPQRVRVQRGRPGQRSVEEHRRRRDVEETDWQRPSRRRIRTHRHRGVSEEPAGGVRRHRAGVALQRVDRLHQSEGRSVSQQRRRRHLAVHVELESTPYVRQPADHRPAGRSPDLSAEQLLVLGQRRRDIHIAANDDSRRRSLRLGGPEGLAPCNQA